METQDPFLFAVYHKDHYPAGNENMEAPRIGNGSDFSQTAEYRMYHGRKIPGFPQHPHRGFETVTCTIDGIIDHTDSLGCGGRYGNGDVQYMTAGKGIVHGENFPLLHRDKPNPTRFFQLWLNLPARSKMVDPTQRMLWAENIPCFQSKDQKCNIRVWTGELNGVKGLPPTPNSWAADAGNDVGIFLIQMAPFGKYLLPACQSSSNRSLYFVEGSSLIVGDKMLPKSSLAVLSPASVELENNGSDAADVLILQGKPIGEPVVQHGPFVMNTQQEIYQAFADYHKTQFGGWPWEEDAVIFPREQGRFLEINGKKEFPPKKEN
uniref:Pirin n=1 Tax=Arcella intermedia TaxID=1963864 RepID=A0A6B2LA35_9EUKA